MEEYLKITGSLGAGRDYLGNLQDTDLIQSDKWEHEGGEASNKKR